MAYKAKFLDSVLRNECLKSHTSFPSGLRSLFHGPFYKKNNKNNNNNQNFCGFLNVLIGVNHALKGFYVSIIITSLSLLMKELELKKD